MWGWKGAEVAAGCASLHPCAALPGCAALPLPPCTAVLGRLSPSPASQEFRALSSTRATTGTAGWVPAPDKHISLRILLQSLTQSCPGARSCWEGKQQRPRAANGRSLDPLRAACQGLPVEWHKDSSAPDLCAFSLEDGILPLDGSSGEPPGNGTALSWPGCRALQG